jgi:hypothetical protein
VKGALHAQAPHPLPAPVELGRIVVTRTLLERLRIGDEDDLVVQIRDLAPLLHRYASGDWGDVSDPWVNEAALKDGSRLLSVYEVRGEKVWIITDAETNACGPCWTGVGTCEPDKGSWDGGVHFREDLPPRRLSTTVLLPEDY